MGLLLSARAEEKAETDSIHQSCYELCDEESDVLNRLCVLRNEHSLVR